ncbi:MAG TPA: glycosyltransferase family 1 protein [Gemmatimonadales bacterium]|jgi:glycosyltransferase involved in cell wall biosynthesis|nr:glycosyltransferase family 1 protein [Gemmatimonadales bacterium]
MRIALFSEVYWPMVSGVGVTLVRLVDALQARGHEVRVYSATYDLPPGVADRPEVHRSPSIPLFLYPDVQWAFPRHRAVLQDVAVFAPDIVHVATEFAMGKMGLRVARELGIPAVASAHTDYEKYAARYGLDWVMGAGWSYLRWFYRQTGIVLSPSGVYERHLNARGIPNTGIWTRGVDTESFHPRYRSETYRRALGLEPRDFLVTYVGRIAREKDLDLLLQAWQMLGRRDDARLVLVGRGPMEAELAQREIPGLVLAGLREGVDLSAAYASADIFAFPSTTETFGNVLLEAMASGLPCLAAAAGGVVEFARHGSNAWLVAPGNPAAIAAGLDRLLADEDLRRVLAAGARKTGCERRWDFIFDELIEQYRVQASHLVRRAA